MIIKPNCCEKPVNAARSTLWIAALVKVVWSSYLIYNFPLICNQIKKKKTKKKQYAGRFVLNSDEITQDHEKCTITLSENVDTITYYFN